MTSITGQTDQTAIEFASDAPTIRVPRIVSGPITLRLPTTVFYRPAPNSSWQTGHVLDARHTPARPGGGHSVTASESPPRRNAAPLGLRIIVMGLCVMFCAALVGVVLVHSRPTWFHSLRNMIGQPAVVHQQQNNVLLFAGGLQYFVPDASYTVVLNISHPCWIIVRQLGSGATLFAETLQPANTGQRFNVTGSTSIEIAARANSITVLHGLKTLGVIHDPVVGATYNFRSRPTLTSLRSTTP